MQHIEPISIVKTFPKPIYIHCTRLFEIGVSLFVIRNLKKLSKYFELLVCKLINAFALAHILLRLETPFLSEDDMNSSKNKVRYFQMSNATLGNQKWHKWDNSNGSTVYSTPNSALFFECFFVSYFTTYVIFLN